jgi:trimethylamine--corrinoid protein Co-methyltransferase
MNDEIIGLVRRIMRGVEVSAETIMLDLIEKVGPGGQFLTEPRSASISRSEVWMPGLLDRNPYEAWVKKGGTDLEARVGQKLKHILGTHRPAPLNEAAGQRIAEILRLAEQTTNR